MKEPHSFTTFTGIIMPAAKPTDKLGTGD